MNTKPSSLALGAHAAPAQTKDIRLDVQNTRSDTYLLGLQGKGLLTTLRINHR